MARSNPIAPMIGSVVVSGSNARVSDRLMVTLEDLGGWPAWDGVELPIDFDSSRGAWFGAAERGEGLELWCQASTGELWDTVLQLGCRKLMSRVVGGVPEPFHLVFDLVPLGEYPPRAVERRGIRAIVTEWWTDG